MNKDRPPRLLSGLESGCLVLHALGGASPGSDQKSKGSENKQASCDRHQRSSCSDCHFREVLEQNLSSVANLVRCCDDQMETTLILAHLELQECAAQLLLPHQIP